MEEMEERVEFGCYTKMSKMLGISSVKEYIEEAVKRGWKAIGITDLESVQCFSDAQNYINRRKIENLKLIYGTKFQFKDKDKINNIIILVKEQKGLKNLYTLLSKGLTTSSAEPLLEKDDLNKYREGLLYGSYGTEGEVYKNLDKEEVVEIAKYYDFIQIEPIYNAKIRRNIKCEYSSKDFEIEDTSEMMKASNKKLIEIGKKSNVIVIANSNPLFVKKEESICNEILNHSKKITDFQYNNDRYLHTTEEMLQEFNYIDTNDAYEIVITNTNKLADLCEEINVIPNQAISYPEIENAGEIIKDKCNKKAREIYGEILPQEVQERLDLEISSIIKNHFEFIYLLASEVAEKSNELGYPVGARGSVGNSFVAFLLGITDYNPIEYNLPFEMFAKVNLDAEPDIDLNFSGEIIDNIHQYIIQKYGKDNVLYCGTIGILSEKTVNQMIEDYCQDLNISITIEKKNELINKLVGIKRSEGIHPGGLIILPSDKNINDLTPIVNYEYNKKSILKTHLDYHQVYSNLYKFDVLSHDVPTMLHKLKEMTKVDYKEISLTDKETLAIFLNAGNEKYEVSILGIPEFGTQFVINMMKIVKPANFNDLVCISALSHGTDTWNWNADRLIENKHIPVEDVISNRADIMNFLMNNGIDRKTAFEITEFVRRGKAYKARTQQTQETEIWNSYKSTMQEHNIPKWYIESCECIKYLFPKAHSIGYTMNAFRIAWYKVHHPEAFYKVYFEMNTDIDIDKYTNKKQIKREINKLETLYEENQDLKCKNKIEDLKILLEMYERGIKQETKRAKDDYDLINSMAIGEYCREINHKFNTEELAVLVYRNKKMDITEKIAKYEELINSYPDMEVIERINCEHYDSVKAMITEETERLSHLKDKFQAKDSGTLYSYELYYASTRKWDKPYNMLESIRTSFQEIDKEIAEYVHEYNDVLAYRVSKRYLNSCEPTITAEYQVIDNQRILTNIHASDNNFLNIDNIFLNIPTPFKKGDILVAWTNTPYREGLPADDNSTFVLDKLCTWKDGLDESLAKGNCDSSDMFGYGYYLDEDSNEFVIDCVWYYDSYEYYEGNLTGIHRILKTISSFIKGKISLELFTHAYEQFKFENRHILANWYSVEGLKDAGFSEKDIVRWHEKQNDTKSMMNHEEKLNYIKYQSYWFNMFNEKTIKQIEFDQDNYAYILINNGNLYKDDEKINSNIDKIYKLDEKHFYGITKDNKIIPLQEIYQWNDLENKDKYLNYDNYSYKKVVTSPSHIVALTKEGDIRALHNISTGLGIISENFKGVEDVIIREVGNIEMPYVFKNNEYVPLYVG